MAYVDVDKLAIDDYRIDLSQYVKKSDLINIAHPIGDIMIRLDNINPGTLPGYEGTVWQLVSQDRVPIGAGGKYTVGAEGGGETHRHKNPKLTHTGNTGDTRLSAAQSGLRAHSHPMGHTHTIGDEGFYFYAGKDKVERRTVKNGTGNSFTNMLYAVTANDFLERWTYTNTSSITNTGSNGAADATQGHHHTNNHEHAETYTDYQNNLPPYKAFNIWMRIQ